MTPNLPQRPTGPYRLPIALTIGALILVALMGGLAVGLFRYFQQDTDRGYGTLLFWLLLVVMALFLAFVGTVAYHTIHILRQSLRAEAALKASEDQLRQIFDLAPIGKALTTPAGQFMQANAAFCTLVGYSEEELRGRTFLDITHPDDIKNNLAWFQRLLDGEVPEYHFEKRYIHRDGHAILVLLHATLVRDEKGQPKQVIAQALEIGERLRAEEGLRQQNEYLAALHETALAIINRLELVPLLESIVSRAASLIGTTHTYVDLELPDGAALEQQVGNGIFSKTVGQRIQRGEGVSGQVWQSGQAILIEDYSAWPEQSHVFLDAPFHAITGVPLRSGGRTVGVLGLAYTEPERRFSRHQIELLSRFAELASLALDNARLYSAVQSELAERKRAGALRTALYRIAQAADDPEGLDDLFRLVHDSIKAIMPAENFYVALYDAQTDLMSFPYFVDAVDSPAPPRKPGRWLSDYVLRTGKSLFATPEKRAQLERTGEVAAGGVPSKVWLGVPLVVDNKSIGVMAVQHYADPAVYNENDLHLLERVSAEVARAIERKRAAQAIQRERDFALQVMNALGQGLVVTGSDSRYEFVNPAFARLIGRQPEEVIGQSPADVVWPEDHGLLDAQRQRRAGGETSTYEIRLQHAHGHPVHVLNTGVPRHQDGRVIGTISAITDLTERHQIEAALRSSEEKFNKAFHSSPVPMSIEDAQGRFIEVNDAFVRVIGYTPQELLGRTASQLALWPDPVEQAQARERFAAEGLLQELEIQFRRKSGEVCTGLLSLETVVLNGEACAIGLVLDITERKRAEEALRRSEQRFRVLAENAPGVIYQCRNDSRYTMLYLNDMIEALTGYSKEDFLEGRVSLQDLGHPDDNTHDRTLVEAALAARQPFHLVYRSKHRSGEWRWIEEWGTGVYDPGGSLLLLEGFLSDITERKQAEENYRTIFENAVEGIYQSTPEGKILRANPALARIFGYASPEALTALTTDITRQLYVDPARRAELMRVADEGREVRGLESQVYRADGSVIWISESARAVRDGNGRVLYYEGTLEDVTDRKLAQAQLERNARELAALDHVGKAVAASLELSVVLDTVIDELTPLIRAEGMSVLLPEGDNRLVFAAASGPASDGLIGHRIPLMSSIAGGVMRTGQSALMAGGDSEPQLYRQVEQVTHYHTRSLLAVPLSLGGKVIGVMEAVHTRPDAFTREDQRLLEAAATWAAIAIGNARQHQHLQRRLQESEAITAISRALNETLDLPVILQLIVDSARQVIPVAERAIMHLYDDASNMLRPVAASGRPLGPDDLMLRPGQGISGRVFAGGTLINIANTLVEPAFVPMKDGPDPASLLSVPVQSGTRRLGTLNIGSAQRSAFSTDDEHLLTHLGVQAALAIENARLFEAARRRADELNAASDILRSLNGAANIAESFPVIADGLKSLTGCQHVSLASFDDRHEWAAAVAAEPRWPDPDTAARLPIGASALAQAVLAGQSYYTPDLALEVDDESRQVFYDAGYRSKLVLPLRVGDDTIGSLSLCWLVTSGYNLSQLPLLEQIADATGLAMEKNRLLVETTETLSREQRLNEVSRTISGALDRSSILETITRLAAELIGADAAALALVSDDGLSIASVHLINFPDTLNNVPVPHGQGVAWEIVDTRRPVHLDDYASHPRALPDWVAAGVRAFVGVPLLAGPDCLGVLGLFRSEQDRRFTARDVAIAESVGRQAGVALQNARLFHALSQEKRRIELLYTLSQSLTTTLDPREVASRAVELTTGALAIDVGEVFQTDSGSEHLSLVAMSGYTAETVDDLNQRVNLHVGQGLTGRVALNKKPILAPNVAENPYWLHIAHLDDGIESVASLPLLVGDALIGVFTLLSQQRNFFEEEQLPTLTAVATSVALAFQNAQLFEAARQRVAALTALHETALQLSTEVDLPALLRSIVERAARLLGAPIGGLSLLLPDGQTLELVVNYNSPVDHTGARVRVGEGAVGMAVQTGAPLIVNNYPQWEHRAEAFKDAAFRSVVAVPIKWRGHIMGVITANDVRVNAFVAADIELISLFADQAAVAIANARQHQELQRRLQESDAVASISRALNETLDLQKLLLLIVDSAHRIIPNVERAVIHLLDQDGQTLRPASVSGEGESGQSLIMRSGEGVAGQVIARGIVINVADTHADMRYLAPEHASPTRALLVAPVQSGTHRLGTLSVNSTTPYAFSSDDERLLGTLSTQAALAIYNAQLFEDTRRQLDELLLLHTMAIAGAEATSEDELLERTTRLMLETFYPVSFGVMLLDESGRSLRAHKSYISGPPAYRVPIGQGITGRVAATGQPMLVPDVRLEPGYLNADPKTRSELCVPLKAGAQILGVMNAESEILNAFSEQDLRLLTTLAGQIATAIQKLRLYRDLEQSLKQEKATRAQLVQSEKLAAMGRLVASVAHELNNPLQAIQNALYLVRQEPALGQQAIEDLHVAATEATRMADLINRLRETYRPTTSEEFHFESINAIVTEVQKLIGTHLRHNDIEFKFEPDLDLPYIPGIRDQLKQVMLNLCLNAVEAMSPGGRLTVRTRYDSVLSSVQLTVLDTGSGIPEDILPSIFDPFFTTKDSGTGLGLTITYDIIQRHNGRIEVESQAGGGAMFHIWLPVELKSKSR